MIIVTAPDKPLAYTGKGSISRQACIKDYTAEIRSTYQAVKESSELSAVTPKSWELASSKLFIRGIVEKVLKPVANAIADDAELFGMGLDRYEFPTSFSILQLRKKSKL